MSGGRAGNVAYGALGIGLFLALWETIGQLRLAGLTWPPFTTVVAFMVDPARSALLGRAAASTLSKALGGYLLGTILGIALAGLAHSIPILRAGLDRLSGFVHAIPAIALAPIFMVLLDRDDTGMAIATINVFFVLYVATTSGLNNASAPHRDLFSVLGATPFRRLVSLSLPAALPALVSGLKFAVPAAMIGAILGEWFGASRGIGLLMVSAMQNFQIPLLWAAVLIASITSLAAFGLVSGLERFVYRRFR